MVEVKVKKQVELVHLLYGVECKKLNIKINIIMTRSLYKGPFIDNKLLMNLIIAKNKNINTLYTRSRSSVITFDFLNFNWKIIFTIININSNNPKVIHNSCCSFAGIIIVKPFFFCNY